MKQFTETNQEIVEKWKKGEGVWSAELGGIGPSYEQTIQVLLFEVFSEWGDKAMPDSVDDKYPDEFETVFNKTASNLNLGFSGAQAGAAKCTAYQFIKFGYSEMMNKLDPERHILVDNRLKFKKDGDEV